MDAGLRVSRIPVNEHRYSAYLVFFKAVLKDILDNKTTSFTKSDFVLHYTKGMIDVLHDLWWRLGLAEARRRYSL